MGIGEWVWVRFWWGCHRVKKLWVGRGQTILLQFGPHHSLFTSTALLTWNTQSKRISVNKILPKRTSCSITDKLFKMWKIRPAFWTCILTFNNPIYRHSRTFGFLLFVHRGAWPRVVQRTDIHSDWCVKLWIRNGYVSFFLLSPWEMTAADPQLWSEYKNRCGGSQGWGWHGGEYGQTVTEAVGKRVIEGKITKRQN